MGIIDGLDLPSLADRGRERYATQKGATPTTKQVKARKGRSDAAVEASVRAQCVLRDGNCIIGRALKEACSGESEHAHTHDKRRSKTRGLAPDVRHTTADSFMACTGHHKDYDAKRVTVTPRTSVGMNGAYRVKRVA